jgi:hypothetical protein
MTISKPNSTRFLKRRKYGVIYADPPWSFRNWSAEGTGRNAVSSQGAGAPCRPRPSPLAYSGQRVRLLHPAPLLTSGGKEMVWDDIRTAPREHMQMSFQHRRHGIVGDCRQMKVDVDSYNDAHPDDDAIQIVFDFAMDLAEIEAAEEAA